MKKIFFAICLILICLGIANVNAQSTTDLKVNGNFINLFGRKVELDKNGFPKQIQTFFNKDATAYQDTANNILAENIHFHFVRKSDGKNIKFVDDGVVFIEKSGTSIRWRSKSTNDSLQVDVEGSIGLKGRLVYFVKVTALQDVALKDVTMHIPFQKNGAGYINGLVQKYGMRPEKVEWMWNGAPQKEEIWIGNPSGGLQYGLGDEKSIRAIPTDTSFEKPSLPPTSWDNNGKGGITIGIKGSSMLANNFTGERQMTKGEVLYFNFTILITPPNTTSK